MRAEYHAPHLPPRQFEGQLHEQPSFFRHLNGYRYMGSFEGKDVYLADYREVRDRRVIVVSARDHVTRTMQQVFGRRDASVMGSGMCESMFWDLVRAALAMQGVKQQ